MRIQPSRNLIKAHSCKHPQLFNSIYSNLRVANDKIEQLKDPNSKLNEEERQELIYSILLEQLNATRKELLAIKKKNFTELSKSKSRLASASPPKQRVESPDINKNKMTILE
jgi:hypothetical protein